MVDDTELTPEETPPEEAQKPVQRAEQDTVEVDEDDEEPQVEEGLPVESTR